MRLPALVSLAFVAFACSSSSTSSSNSYTFTDIVGRTCTTTCPPNQNNVCEPVTCTGGDAGDGYGYPTSCSAYPGTTPCLAVWNTGELDVCPSCCGSDEAGLSQQMYNASDCAAIQCTSASQCPRAGSTCTSGQCIAPN
jgi:hypothetical protein